jgi:hypothetical protein
MSGLLRRLTRRRPATADENVSPTAASSEPVAAPAETPAESGGQPPVPVEQPTVVLPATSEQPAVPLPAWSVAADQPTAFAAQPAPPRDLPAGVDPHDLATAPAASARRGKLRRRLRYLRHVRELLLRDLGGFTYEVHRTAGGTAQEPQRRLTAAKSQRIAALDAEVLALESRLGEPHAEALLREPGIGGTCHECGELHASDAHFCSRCGAPLDAKARAQRAAEQPTTGSHAVVEPQPASVLWAGGPRPSPEPREEEAETPEPPSSVTSQWLTSDQPTTFDPAPKPDEPAAAAPVESDEPTATAPDEPSAAAPVEPADEPTATAPDKPADEPAPDPDQQDDAAPPAPATAAARAKPKRASKPRKPAKRAPAKPRPAAPEPQTEADEPRPTSDFTANGRRDEDVPPPLSSGDPLASPREQGS